MSWSLPVGSRPTARAAPPLRGRLAQVPRAARTGPPIRAGVSTRATRRARDHRRRLQPLQFPSKLAVATRRWFRSDARGSPTLSLTTAPAQRQRPCPRATPSVGALVRGRRPRRGEVDAASGKQERNALSVYARST